MCDSAENASLKVSAVDWVESFPHLEGNLALSGGCHDDPELLWFTHFEYTNWALDLCDDMENHQKRMLKKICLKTWLSMARDIVAQDLGSARYMENVLCSVSLRKITSIAVRPPVLVGVTDDGERVLTLDRAL